MSKNDRDLTNCDNASFDLGRFVKAQSSIYDTALAEICARRKRTHWMWFIFPQLRGLAASTTSNYYGIDGIGEAYDYIKHPLLGSRLVECTRAMCETGEANVQCILGEIDAAKFRSCMTLFELADDQQPCFVHALHQFFNGDRDSLTFTALKFQPNADKNLDRYDGVVND